MEDRIREYKERVIDKLKTRFNLSELEAKEMARDFGLEGSLKYALQNGKSDIFDDDPEIWADMVYEWTPSIKELLGKESL